MAVTIKINPCPERYNSANPYKTGQTTSYATNDDGDLERGRGSDFTTLDFNNPFGNTNRFTDTTGAQTYANDIVIDWATTNYINETVIGWYRVVQGGANWATAMSGQPYTKESLSNWYVPNVNEMHSILSYEDTLNYAPFSITDSCWTSTTQVLDTTYGMIYSASVGFIARNPKTNAQNYILVRTFTFTELGI